MLKAGSETTDQIIGRLFVAVDYEGNELVFGGEDCLGRDAGVNLWL